jgi:regulator of replication initiation timing
MTSIYQRPNITYQERLTNIDIKEKLKDYIIVEDINNVDIGTHLRYFIYDIVSKTKKFRLGGSLCKIDNLGRFLTLTNGHIKWSVQIPNTIFYKKLSNEEYREELKKEIMTELESDNNDLIKAKKLIKNLNIKIKNLIEENIILKKNNDKLNNQLTNINIQINKKLKK